MNHHQIERTGMYKKMLIFFANPLHVIIWASFTRLSNEIANFIALETTHTNQTQRQQIDTKGLTKAKNEAFDAMLFLLLNKLSRAYVWAVDSGNENLQHLFDVQKTYFIGVSEVKAYNKIKNLRDALSSNIASMASVQLDNNDLSAINMAVTAYENTIGTTGAAQSHKITGTIGIEELLQPLDKSLDIIDKLLVSTYSESNADMVQEYLQNRNIEKLPTHHSGISIHLVNAATGKDLEGAGIAVNGKSSLSDIDGMAEIIKIRPGTYNLSVTMEGYTPQIIKILIEKGKVNRMEIAMVMTGAA